MRAHLRGHVRPALAFLGSEVLSPPVLIALTVVVLALVTDPRWMLTVPVTVLCLAVIPQALAFWLMARGRAGDKFIARREDRHLFYPLVLAAFLVGTLLAALLSDSAWIVGVCLMALLVNVVVSLINRWSKISLHALIAGMSGLLLPSAAGWWLLLATVPAAVVVCWSRVTQRRHSPFEVISGACVGIAAAILLLAVLGVPQQPLGQMGA